MFRSSFAARLTTLGVVALAAVALAVPALATSSRAASTAVRVTATDFHFKLSRASAPHGVIVFTLVNSGHTMHDFMIGGKKTALITHGHSAKVTVTLKKGRYAYKCTVPGHAALGMKGTFVVK